MTVALQEPLCQTDRGVFLSVANSGSGIGNLLLFLLVFQKLSCHTVLIDSASFYVHNH